MQVNVFSGNSMRGVFARLAPEFARVSGHELVAHYDPAQVLLRRIAAGEVADVAILGEGVIDDLIAHGAIVAASRRALVRNGVGVGVRAGAARPRIDTVDAFKKALLAAPSIAHTTEGASGIYFSSLIERLGIAAEIRAKAVTQQGGLVGELVIAGKAEIAIQQIPELLAVQGIELVGPFPAEVQKIGTSCAGIFSAARAPQAGAALIEFLTTASAGAAFRAAGFEPLF